MSNQKDRACIDQEPPRRLIEQHRMEVVAKTVRDCVAPHWWAKDENQVNDVIAEVQAIFWAKADFVTYDFATHAERFVKKITGWVVLGKERKQAIENRRRPELLRREQTRREQSQAANEAAFAWIEDNDALFMSGAHQQQAEAETYAQKLRRVFGLTQKEAEAVTALAELGGGHDEVGQALGGVPASAVAQRLRAVRRKIYRKLLGDPRATLATLSPEQRSYARQRFRTLLAE